MLSKSEFKEYEAKCNEYIQHQIKKNAENLSTGVKYEGELNDEHIAVKMKLAKSDDNYNKQLKEGRLTVDDVLERWKRTDSSAHLIASSLANARVLTAANKKYLFIKIRIK